MRRSSYGLSPSRSNAPCVESAIDAGKGELEVWRRRAQVGEGELVLLGPAPTALHVVHRSAARHHPIKVFDRQRLAHQEVMGRHALVGGRRPVTRVEDEKLMEERRAAPPVTEDEYRFRVWSGLGDALGVLSPLAPTHDRVDERDRGRAGGEWPSCEWALGSRPYLGCATKRTSPPLPRSKRSDRSGVDAGEVFKSATVSPQGQSSKSSQLT